jgi:hypothetical protein
MSNGSSVNGTATIVEVVKREFQKVGVAAGEGLDLLGIWRGAPFAVIHQTGFGEPGKGAPHGDETTCFATHA